MKVRKKQLNVLHVVSGEYKPGNGIYTVVNTLLENLQDDIQCSLLISNDFQSEKYNVYSRNQIKFNTLLQSEKIDLVIFHGIFFPQYLKDYKYCIKFNIPYLVKPHSSLMRSSWSKGRLRKKIFYYLGLKQFLYKSKGILFINKEEEKNSFNFCPNSFIERNGINFNDEYFPKKTSSKVRFLFFSRIDFHHKGLDYLLKSLLLLKKKNLSDLIEFNFYGPGSKSEVKKMVSFLKRNNLSFAQYLGPVYDKIGKQKMFENSDILILTSRYEGFPTVIPESLFNGIPPLVTPGTNAMFLNEDKIGWNCKLNANEIAEKIISAAKEYKENGDLINNRCISYVKENFVLERSLKETMDIYNVFK